MPANKKQLMKVTNMSITNIKRQDMSVSHETVVNEFADVVQAMPRIVQ